MLVYSPTLQGAGLHVAGSSSVRTPFCVKEFVESVGVQVVLPPFAPVAGLVQVLTLLLFPGATPQVPMQVLHSDHKHLMSMLENLFS